MYVMGDDKRKNGLLAACRSLTSNEQGEVVLALPKPILLCFRTFFGFP